MSGETGRRGDTGGLKLNQWIEDFERKAAEGTNRLLTSALGPGKTPAIRQHAASGFRLTKEVNYDTRKATLAALKGYIVAAIKRQNKNKKAYMRAFDTNACTDRPPNTVLLPTQDVGPEIMGLRSPLREALVATALELPDLVNEERWGMTDKGGENAAERQARKEDRAATLDVIRVFRDTYAERVTMVAAGTMQADLKALVEKCDADARDEEKDRPREATAPTPGEVDALC